PATLAVHGGRIASYLRNYSGIRRLRKAQRVFCTRAIRLAESAGFARPDLGGDSCSERRRSVAGLQKRTDTKRPYFQTPRGQSFSGENGYGREKRLSDL